MVLMTDRDKQTAQLIAKIDQLKDQIRKMDPPRLAERVGGTFEDGAEPEIHLKLWGEPVTVRFPSLETDGLPQRPDLLALLFYHLETSDGAPLEGRWISFHELPDGKFYAQAFQGYTGAKLARALNGELELFIEACGKAGGERLSGETIPGDAAFRFEALPKVPVLAAFWSGDEDFPANAQVLFDASAPHHLPTDAYAIVGSALVRRILKSSTNLHTREAPHDSP